MKLRALIRYSGKKEIYVALETKEVEKDEEKLELLFRRLVSEYLPDGYIIIRKSFEYGEYHWFPNKPY